MFNLIKLTTLILPAASVVSGAAVAVTSDGCPASYFGPPVKQCGKLNIAFVGLPWSHPAVFGAGYTPQQVENGIRGDVANITKSGYNIKAVLVAPENPLSDITSELQGTRWDALGVGFGIRASPNPNVTVRFQEIIETFRRMYPASPILFNYSPVTAAWAIKREFPMPDCSKKQGTGTIVTHCNVCKPPQ